MIESYLRAVGMFRDYSNPDQDPIFSQVREREGGVIERDAGEREREREGR